MNPFCAWLLSVSEGQIGALKPGFSLCVLGGGALKRPGVTSRKRFCVETMHPSEARETSEQLAASCPKSHSDYFRTCLVYDATLFLST